MATRSNKPPENKKKVELKRYGNVSCVASKWNNHNKSLEIIQDTEANTARSS